MAEARVVLLKIAGMFLLILGGWLARRRGWLGAEASAVLSRLVVDAAFPALVFVQLLRTVDAASLRQDWILPLLPVPLVGLAWVAGAALLPLFGGRERRSTALFLASSPNWVFLPLPIAEALHGAAGVRVVLLANLGAQLSLWTLGVGILHGDVRKAARGLAGNLGLWGTVAGLAAALAFPGLRSLIGAQPAGAGGLALAAVLDALNLLGSLTIPLSLLAIGAQLGTVPLHPRRIALDQWGVALVRLVAAPLAAAALLAALPHVGLPLGPVARQVVFIMAAMPVALVCSVMAERFGGDAPFAAQGVFLTTLLSLATVPLLVMAVG